jgi:hypothetical protein
MWVLVFGAGMILWTCGLFKHVSFSVEMLLHKIENLVDRFLSASAVGENSNPPLAPFVLKMPDGRYVFEISTDGYISLTETESRRVYRKVLSLTQTCGSASCNDPICKHFRETGGANTDVLAYLSLFASNYFSPDKTFKHEVTRDGDKTISVNFSLVGREDSHRDVRCMFVFKYLDPSFELRMSNRNGDYFWLRVDGEGALTFIGVDERVYNKVTRIKYLCRNPRCRDPFCCFFKKRKIEGVLVQAGQETDSSSETSKDEDIPIGMDRESLLMFRGFDFEDYSVALFYVFINEMSIEIQIVLNQKEFKGHNVSFTFLFSNLDGVYSNIREADKEMLRIPVPTADKEKLNMVQNARYVWIMYSEDNSSCFLVARGFHVGDHDIILQCNGNASEIKLFRDDSRYSTVQIHDFTWFRRDRRNMVGFGSFRGIKVKKITHPKGGFNPSYIKTTETVLSFVKPPEMDE